MKSLHNTLNEALLDLDMDDVLSGVEQDYMDEFLSKYCSGKHKIMKLKNGTRKVWGTLIIRNYEDTELPPLNISFMEGDLYIEHCGITSLTNLFHQCGMKGSLHITDCKNFSSFEGSPWTIRDWLYVTSCPSLKSLDGMPEAFEGTSIIKCGKKFKESQIRKATSYTGKVYCAEETELANINEALMDPVLIRFMDQLKKLGHKQKLAPMISWSDKIKYDEITPSMRQTFKYPAEKAKMLTAARKIITNSAARTGFILCEDCNGNFVYSINGDLRIVKLPVKPEDEPESERADSSTEIISLLDGKRERWSEGSYYMGLIERVHIYNITANFSDLSAYDKIEQRDKAREGMVDMSASGMRRMLKKQRERYKLAVIQLKATRNSEQYKKRADKVAELMERFAKFIRKTVTEPKWFDANRWRCSEVFSAFRQGYIPPTSYNKNPVQRYGLIYVFEQWVATINKKMLGQSTFMGTTNEEMDAAIEWADMELSKLNF